MTEGKIVRWLKREGDPVRRGEPLAEIETEKVVIEIESYDAGVLRKIVAPADQVVPVGHPIAVIAGADEDISGLVPGPVPAPAGPAVAVPPAAVGQAPSPAAQPVPQAIAAPSEEPLRVSPVAQRLAEERGIDVRQVSGTGPGGRITKEDVLAYAEKPAAPAPAAAPAAGVQPLSPMRQAIARAVTQSINEIPQYQVTMKIDMTEAVRFRKSLNETAGEEAKVTVNDLVVKAVSLALKKSPQFNASYRDGGIQYHPGIHIGMAVAIEDGLVVPALSDCDQKSLIQIARDTKELIARAQQRRLRPEEMTGGTFTVSNLGMFDVHDFIAIVLPPQCAMLAVGAVQPEAVVRDGQVGVAQMMRVTISADHRITDGAQAAQFLRELKRLLENPVSLLL